MADDISIRADGEHVYAVHLTRADGTEHRYRVSVSERLLDDLGSEPADEPFVVRAAVETMLDRPDSPMPDEFDLANAEQAYPGLLDELRAKVGRY